MRIRSKEDLKRVDDEWLKENLREVLKDILELVEELELKEDEIREGLPKDRCSCGGYLFPFREERGEEEYTLIAICSKCYKKKVAAEID